MENLTDLEAAALGCVYRNFPCTAHFVRTQFRESHSARFSDSAGSVYPTMKRLQNRELLNSYLQKDGQRMVRYYECTMAGRAALRRWIGPPLGDDVAITIDPLRTRILHLELLSPRRRAQWLEQAETTLQQKLVELDEHEGREDKSASTRDLFFEMADENAQMEIESRLKWIQRARRRFRAAGLLQESSA